MQIKKHFQVNLTEEDIDILSEPKVHHKILDETDKRTQDQKYIDAFLELKDKALLQKDNLINSIMKAKIRVS